MQGSLGEKIGEGASADIHAWAPAAFDHGISHIILTELAPDVVDNPQRPRAVNAAAQSEYARLAGISQAALTAAMEPYLPIVRVRVLLGGRCLPCGSG